MFAATVHGAHFRVVTPGRDGELVEDQAEQAIVMRAHDLRAGGATLRAIQAAVEAQHGQRVSLDALARVLREAA